MEEAPPIPVLGVIVQEIMQQEGAEIFNEPLDADELGLHDYYDIIKQPMDLGTIKDKIARSAYHNPNEVMDDVAQVWKNAFKTSSKNSEIYRDASNLSRSFDEKVKNWKSKYRSRAPPQPRVNAEPTRRSAHVEAVAPPPVLAPEVPTNYAIKSPPPMVRPPIAMTPPAPTPMATPVVQSFVPVFNPPVQPVQPPVQQLPRPTIFIRPPQVKMSNSAQSNVPIYNQPTHSPAPAYTPPPQYNKTPSPFREQIDQILDRMEDITDITGRTICDLFLTLPSRELYPDYYVLIKRPISFAEMRKKSYKSPESFKNDFLLLCRNAQNYNQVGSMVYNDSATLAQKFKAQYAATFAERAPEPTFSANVPTPPVPRPRKRLAMSDDEGEEADADFEDEAMEVEVEYDEGSSGDEQQAKRRRLETPRRARDVKPIMDTPDKSNVDSVDIDGEEPEEEEVPKSFLPLFDQPPIYNVVEKILKDRKDKETEQNEFYVKWKGRAYIHCSWVKESDLMADPVDKKRVTRYWQSKNKAPAAKILDDVVVSEEDLYADYMEAERIVDSRVDIAENGDPLTVYLVKWKSLPHTECTWETKEDVDNDEKIRQFEQSNIPPNQEELRPRPRLKWEKMETASFKDNNQLRPYQMEGMNWLTFCWADQRGSILADEMGLGKTVQSISLLHYLHQVQHIRGPFLVVASIYNRPLVSRAGKMDLYERHTIWREQGQSGVDPTF